MSSKENSKMAKTVKYKEIRKLGAGRMRALCIKKSWYTAGDNVAYNNLLEMASADNITTELIAEMAIDIEKHSTNYGAENGYGIPQFMFEIAKCCISVFEEE